MEVGARAQEGIAHGAVRIRAPRAVLIQGKEQQRVAQLVIPARLARAVTAYGDLGHAAQGQFPLSAAFQNGDLNFQRRLVFVHISVSGPLPVPQHVVDRKASRRKALGIAGVVQLLQSGGTGFRPLESVQPGAHHEGGKRGTRVVAVQHSFADGQGVFLIVQPQGHGVIRQSFSRFRKARIRFLMRGPSGQQRKQQDRQNSRRRARRRQPPAHRKR